jgi:hypothetical protein
LVRKVWNILNDVPYKPLVSPSLVSIAH